MYDITLSRPSHNERENDAVLRRAMQREQD